MKPSLPQHGEMIMNTYLPVAFAAALVLGLASPAFAASCPRDMAAIDAALAENPQLTAEQKSEVEKLRAEGEALHKAGNHGESVTTLHKAMEILDSAK